MLRTFETLSGYWKFEGWILQYDEVPKSFTKADQSGSPLRKRKQTPSEDAGLCMDLLLADRHGPAMVTLWGDTVKQFLELLPSFSPSNTSKPILSLSMMRVASVPQNDWNGPLLSPMHVLHSVAKRGPNPTTSVSLLRSATSPYMHASVVFQVPFHSLVNDFLGNQNRFVAPFRVSLVGIMLNVQEISVSNNGGPKRLFDIVDGTGTYIHCCALGRNATNLALKPGMEAVFFHGTGRSSIGGTVGMVYFMKDSLIVPVSQRDESCIPATRLEIIIR